MTRFHHDYETKSNKDLIKLGLDVYSSDPSTRVLMMSYAFDNDPVKLWTHYDGPFPREAREALLDPRVEKWAFNAPFEMNIARRVLGIKTPTKGWRDAMVLAFMQSFTGGLEAIGQQMGLPVDRQKMADGKRLIRKFTMPQRITKNQTLLWRDRETDPEDWDLFCKYAIQDTVAERDMVHKLIRYPVPEFEWELFEADLQTNARGFPVDMEFVRNGIRMSNQRKKELTAELTDLTWLSNPNSPSQLLSWLKDRGYPFSDLRKDTVKKVLAEHEEEIVPMAEPVVEALKKRQQVARTSVKKYDKIELCNVGGVMRNGFQFAGASRTNRAAGRIINPQNLTRSPKDIEPDSKLGAKMGVSSDYLLVKVTEYIRKGDYQSLVDFGGEPLDYLAGLVRSAIRAPENKTLLACDLASIETCVIAWISGCERLLKVIKGGGDAYKDFATELYGVAYDEVTKFMRQQAKPAVLGAGYRLGGGELREGKRTGMWGYAESLGVNMSKEDATKAVNTYREVYPEIPKLWYALEEAVCRAMRSKRPVVPIVSFNGKKFRVPVTFEYMKPYMTVILPSRRRMYYHKPRVVTETRISRAGNEYEKDVFSYMGKEQGSNTWKRLDTHGGKLVENIVQAIARDILMAGYLKAVKEGFKIVLHVHDELVALVKKGDNYFTMDRLRDCMIQDMEQTYPGLPLNADGWTADFYRK